MKLLAELFVTAAILILIAVFVLMSSVLIPLLATLGGVFMLGLFVFFMVHDPKKPEE